MPIREIAIRWQVDPVLLHREYAKARKEFTEALLETIAFHHPGEAVDLSLECANSIVIAGVESDQSRRPGVCVYCLTVHQASLLLQRHQR